ncbi:MAG: site-2 protease family protein [Pseudobdellovibrionaceae bacterium]
MNMERMSGWTLFSLRGVAVKLHISLILLVIYVVLIALAQFPTVVQMSGVSSSELMNSSLAWALIFAISLIISIFVHEFGHVLVAQAKGYPVHQITLMMLGGVSHLEKMPEKPSDEFKVAIIGPIVSLAIGAVLFGLRAISESANIDFFCYWIGQTNIVLGIFNLLPAFPTDGGRVLRAVLASQQGQLRGTQHAVRISHVFAWALGILGILQFNILLIILALFIYAAAKSELFILVAHMVLKGMTVRDIVDSSVPAVSEDSSVAQVISQMVRSRHVHLPVVGQDEKHSVITIDRVARIPKHLRESTSIKSLLPENFKILQVEDGLEDALMLSMKSQEGGLPVVEDHLLIGLVRTSDLLELIRLRQLILEEVTPEPLSYGLQQAHR